MNIYIVEEQQLIIAVNCKKARKYMSKLKNDRKYLFALKTEFRKLNEPEKPNLLLFHNLGYGEEGEPLEYHLDTKIGLELELFEEGNWKHKEN